MQLRAKKGSLLLHILLQTIRRDLGSSQAPAHGPAEDGHSPGLQGGQQQVSPQSARVLGTSLEDNCNFPLNSSSVYNFPFLCHHHHMSRVPSLIVIQGPRHHGRPPNIRHMGRRRSPGRSRDSRGCSQHGHSQ